MVKDTGHPVRRVILTKKIVNLGLVFGSSRNSFTKLDYVAYHELIMELIPFIYRVGNLILTVQYSPFGRVSLKMQSPLIS